MSSIRLIRQCTSPSCTRARDGRKGTSKGINQKNRHMLRCSLGKTALEVAVTALSVVAFLHCGANVREAVGGLQPLHDAAPAVSAALRGRRLGGRYLPHHGRTLGALADHGTPMGR